jgi:hypothetical protein
MIYVFVRSLVSSGLLALYPHSASHSPLIYAMLVDLIKAELRGVAGYVRELDLGGNGLNFKR